MDLCGKCGFPPPLYGIKVEHAEVTNMDFFYNGQKKGGGG